MVGKNQPAGGPESDRLEGETCFQTLMLRDVVFFDQPAKSATILFGFAGRPGDVAPVNPKQVRDVGFLEIFHRESLALLE